MLLNALYLRTKERNLAYKKITKCRFYAYRLYSTTVNISMCKSCSNMVNLSEKSLPKPML